jgi:hypothetical protein
MAVKGFRMTKNDETALAVNSLGSFHCFSFLFKKTGYLGTPTAKQLCNVKITFTSKHTQFGF